MAYISANPLFKSTTLKNSALATEPSPQSGNYKLIVVDGTLYVKDSAGAETPVGSSTGGKNYILNPDAAQNATDDVNNQATTGSWTITQTTTAAELPEETKGTAFKISGSSLTVNDYVAFEIVATGVDDADGGRQGSWKVAVKDISGSISGQYKLQVYNVTDSVYVGDSQTVVSDFTYQGAVPLNAAADYELHLIALTASPSNIGLSGITISPKSRLEGAVITEWQSYTPSFTGLGTVTAINTQWRQVGSSIEIKGDFTTGTGTATEAQITLPNGYTCSYIDSTSTQFCGSGSLDSTNSIMDLIFLATNGDNFLNVGQKTDGSTANGLSPLNGSALVGSARRISLDISVPVAELQGTTLYASEAQAQNAYSEYEGGTTNSITSGSYELIKYTTGVKDDQGDYDSSTGIYTVPADGKYNFNAKGQITGSTSTTLSGIVLKIGNQSNSSTGAVSWSFDSSGASTNYVDFNESLFLSQGDQVSIHAFWSGTGSGSLSSSTVSTRLSISRIPDKTGSAIGFPFLGDVTTGTKETGMVTKQNATADIGGAPSQTDFNNLLQKLRDAGVLDT